MNIPTCARCPYRTTYQPRGDRARCLARVDENGEHPKLSVLWRRPLSCPIPLGVQW